MNEPELALMINSEDKNELAFTLLDAIKVDEELLMNFEVITLIKFLFKNPKYDWHDMQYYWQFKNSSCSTKSLYNIAYNDDAGFMCMINLYMDNSKYKYICWTPERCMIAMARVLHLVIQLELGIFTLEEIEIQLDLLNDEWKLKYKEILELRKKKRK